MEVDPRYLDSGGRPKKLPSMSSPKDYLCEACSKTFTQNQTLGQHRRFHCPVLGKQKMPKDAKCIKTMAKTSRYHHLAISVCKHVEKNAAAKAGYDFICPKCQRRFRQHLQLEMHACQATP